MGTKKDRSRNSTVPVAALNAWGKTVFTDAAGYRDGPLQARHQRRLFEKAEMPQLILYIMKISSLR